MVYLCSRRMKVGRQHCGKSNNRNLHWFGKRKSTKNQVRKADSFDKCYTCIKSIVVLDLSIDPIRTFVISSSADNQICKYSLATGDVISKITIKKSGAVALRIRPDNKIFALGGYDGRYTIWMHRRCRTNKNTYHCDDRIRLFSVKSMKPLAVLSYHKDTVYSVDFSQSDNWMVCASQDHRISLWSIF